VAKIEMFARTEVGCIRKRNEDSFVVAELATRSRGIWPEQRVRELTNGGTLLSVCDGMGGAAAGDVASGLAVDALYSTLIDHAPFPSTEALQQGLLAAVTSANKSIYEFASQDPTRHGMGTTMTAGGVYGPELGIVHVGDSRAYLVRAQALTQLTTDHSIVGQLIAAGRMTREQARSFEQRNVLLQALGVQPRVGPELVNLMLCDGDLLLFCSDGLTGPLPEELLLDHLLAHHDPVQICRVLTEAASAAGGPDNVTAVVARVSGRDLRKPVPGEPVRLDRSQASA